MASKGILGGIAVRRPGAAARRRPEPADASWAGSCRSPPTERSSPTAGTSCCATTAAPSSTPTPGSRRSASSTCPSRSRARRSPSTTTRGSTSRSEGVNAPVLEVPLPARPARRGRAGARADPAPTAVAATGPLPRGQGAAGGGAAGSRDAVAVAARDGAVRRSPSPWCSSPSGRASGRAGNHPCGCSTALALAHRLGSVPRLRRTSPDQPGWTRRRAGQGFVYLDQYGERLSDAEAQRVRDLVIPPAWTGRLGHAVRERAPAGGRHRRGRPAAVPLPPGLAQPPGRREVRPGAAVRQGAVAGAGAGAHRPRAPTAWS